jgi:hypothetical protein
MGFTMAGVAESWSGPAVPVHVTPLRRSGFRTSLIARSELTGH